MLASPSVDRPAAPWAGKALARVFLWWLLLVACGAAQAHKASDAYLTLHRQGDLLALRWDVALRDLDSVMALDANDDGKLSWGEVKARRADIEGYLQGRLRLLPQGATQACALRTKSAAAPLERRNDGTYFVLEMSGACALPSGAVSVSYQFMAEIDPTHRGLLQVAGAPGKVWSLDPTARRAVAVKVPDEGRLAQLELRAPVHTVAYTPDLGMGTGTGTGTTASTAALLPQAPLAASDTASGFLDMVRDGIHHILIGTDHVLFVLCLLLPSVLQRRPDHRRATDPVASWRQAFTPVLWTITTFTVAHSITLALASVGWVQLSPRVVEPAIAVTIVLAAWDNLRPILRGRRHAFTFLFGLIHGFGFASVLKELNLPTEGFVKALLGFNLGVEVGQLLIVVPAMVLLMALRRWPVYARRVMPVGSVLAMAVASGWFIERVFDLGFMPL